MTIELDAALGSRLTEAAAATGKDPNALARQLLAEHLPASIEKKTPAEQMASLELFFENVSRWIDEHVPEGQFADVDRGWQYEGRGE